MPNFRRDSSFPSIGKVLLGYLLEKILLSKERQADRMSLMFSELDAASQAYQIIHTRHKEETNT